MARTDRQKEALESLTGIVESLYDQLDNGDIPNMSLPQRTKRNIEFDPRHNVWKYGDLKTVRTAKTVNGAVMMLRTVYTTEFINEMIRENKSSTLREMYYISEGWHNAKFHTQDEGNLLAEDLETVTSCMREDFKLRPEESGAHMYGDINITTMTKKGMKTMNCMDDVSEAGFAVPYKVEDDTFQIDPGNTKFVMAIKTAHISEYLATPTAQFVGITASDILNYDLPTDKLNDKDLGALHAELTDPRFADEFWVNEIQAMLQMNKKAEQQALAKYGLDYVTDHYLPEKLTDMGIL